MLATIVVESHGETQVCACTPLPMIGKERTYIGALNLTGFQIRTKSLQQKNQHIEILKILNKRNISYSENKNGIFFNLSTLKDEDIDIILLTEPRRYTKSSSFNHIDVMKYIRVPPIKGGCCKPFLCKFSLK